MQGHSSIFCSRSALSPLCQPETSQRATTNSPWLAESLLRTPIAPKSPVSAVVAKKRLQLSTPTSSPERTTTGSVLTLQCSPCPTSPFRHTKGENVVPQDPELPPSSEYFRTSKRCKLPMSPRLSLKEVTTMVHSSPLGSFPPGTMPQTINTSDRKGGTILWLDFAHMPPSPCTSEPMLAGDRELLRLGMRIAADQRAHCEGKI